jgi:NitT/TauT family transport system substrate-binding protein
LGFFVYKILFLEERRMKKGFRLLVLATILVVVAVAGAACSGSSSSDQPIKLAYNLWIGSAGVYVADEKKLFSEAGVEVEMVQFGSPTEAVQALISGQVDVALTTMDTAVMLKSSESEDDPIRAFYVNDISNGADGIIVKSSINSIQDLKGKDVAVTIGAVNHFLLNHALAEAGMTSSDVNIVNMAPDLTGSTLISGKVDAAVAWEPFLSEAIASGNKLLYSSADAPDLIVDVMVTTQSMLKDRKEDLKKLVDGINKGIAYYEENEAEGTEIAAGVLGTSADSVKEMKKGVKLTEYEDSKRMMTTDVSKLKATIEKINDFFIEFEVMTERANPDELIDSSLFD